VNVWLVLVILAAVAYLAACKWWAVRRRRRAVVVQRATEAAGFGFGKATNVKVREWRDGRIARATVWIPRGVDVEHTKGRVESIWRQELTPTNPDGTPTELWAFTWYPDRRFMMARTLAPVPSQSRPAPALEAEGGTVAARPGHRLPLGVGRDVDIEWDARRHPHMAVAGRTGMGKTVALHAVIRGALAAGWKVALCDPKMFELAGFAGHRGVIEVADEAASMTRVIASVKKELIARQRARKACEAAGKPWPPPGPLLLVVDEVTELVEMTGGPRKSTAVDDLGSIMRLGRALDIHVVVATQRVDVKEALPGSVRDQCDARLGLGRLGPVGARMLYDTADHDTAPPNADPGRGVFVCGGWPRDIQVDHAPPPKPIVTASSEPKPRRPRPAPVVQIPAPRPPSTGLHGGGRLPAPPPPQEAAS
jgi:hypothetical protein